MLLQGELAGDVQKEGAEVCNGRSASGVCPCSDGFGVVERLVEWFVCCSGHYMLTTPAGPPRHEEKLME